MSFFTIKRLKQVAEEFFGRENKQVNVFDNQPDWSQLPYEILLHVFRYLSNSDKYHAALTCKSWLRPLSVPSVWQSGDFVFDNKSDEKAIIFVNMTGKTLRHINVQCIASDNHYMCSFLAFKGDEGPASCTAKMYQFLATLLNSQNHRILTFKLTNLFSLKINGLSAKSMSFSEVAQLLTKVLEDQQQLRVLDLSNSQKSVKHRWVDSFTVNEGLKLLNAASKNCANTLQELAIARFVCLKDIYPNDLSFLPQFRSAIAGFSKLSDLHLSYGYLEDDLLLSLSRTTTSLKVITVRADKIPELESRITPLAWENLTAACPELRVLFFIKPITESYFQDVTMILTPSMPLYQVKWKSGSVTAVENIEKFFQHLGQNFQKTLHHLKFRTRVPIDTERFEVLFKSIQPCTNLDSFSLGLTSCVIDDVEMYKLAIRDVVKRCPLSCDLTLNVQVK
ncbi:F-box/LRR-repeat protein 21-like isoform X3 [Physella acuta]|uniref:F-box/LRR-repeat protein 21-like isoform X3 n=1 Tax=Physella acuta TaxID=109671 RepID=UPI0027DDA3B0|nr:F-box/LRR-repeat protein 21-like isoform X3 [Physella acuta]